MKKLIVKVAFVPLLGLLTLFSVNCATSLSSTVSPVPTFAVVTRSIVPIVGVSRSAACRYFEGNAFFQWVMSISKSVA